MTDRGVHSPLAFLALEGSGTLTDRVFRAIRAGILDGQLAPGQPVPSSRQLASDLGVSRKVVASAYGHLIDEGYLEGRHGAGTFVTTAVPDIRPIRMAPVQLAPVAPRL